MNFIKATEEFTTFENSVPAYYFRKALTLPSASSAKLTIAVCGFYELFFNGKRITKGFLSPYINNTDDFIYYDEYEITLDAGENVIGILLGNGFQNNPGGYIWEFDKASFRSAPMFALEIADDEQILLRSDETFKIAPSPILRDDYRFGEHYDANLEIPVGIKKVLMIPVGIRHCSPHRPRVNCVRQTFPLLSRNARSRLLKLYLAMTAIFMISAFPMQVYAVCPSKAKRGKKSSCNTQIL